MCSFISQATTQGLSHRNLLEATGQTAPIVQGGTVSQAAPPIDMESPEMARKRRSTVVWVVALACVGLIFDGYDLVVYGAVLPTFLQPNGLAEGVTIDKATAGLLGSYALFGVLVGALIAGTLSDKLGRRKVLLVVLRVVLHRHVRHCLDDHRDWVRHPAASSPVWVSAPWLPPPVRWWRRSPHPGRRTSVTRSCTPACRWGRCSPRCWPSSFSPSSAGAACSCSAPSPLSPCFRWRFGRCRSRWRGWPPGARWTEAHRLSAKTGVPVPAPVTPAAAEDARPVP